MQDIVAGLGSPPWPEEFPLPPYRTEGLPVPFAVLNERLNIDDGQGAAFAPRSMVFAAPDGVTTGEICLDPGLADAMEESPATCLGHVISGRRIRRDDNNRGSGEPVLANNMSQLRVVGQCAGAEGYLESLSSGVAAAESLLHQFGSRRAACQKSMPTRPSADEGAGNEG